MFQRTVADRMNIEVFKVKLYDVVNDKTVISRRMATREGAILMGGHIIENSRIVVSPDVLENGEQWTAIGFESPNPHN